MSITPRFLDEIKSRITVSEVVGRTVKIIKAGREYKACCPFHSEKSPSFTINDDKQFYHCFGCGAHGDVIGYLQQHNNLSFVEAVEQLAAQAGLQMPSPDPAFAKKAERDKDLYDLMEQNTQYFQDHLHDPKNKNIYEYVLSRGLTVDDIRNFRIGFAPVDRQVVRTFLSARGFNDKDMLEAGVIKPSRRGGDPYAFFNERVMFPVSDRRGRVIAFGGRTLPDHLMQPNRGDFMPPKYVNSGDTALFDKGRTLFAYSKARQASGDGQPIIVTEGYMDVIACHRAGFTGAVAPMGTALTEEQIILLWKMMANHEKVPILCFDGDNAGRKAAVRSLERIMPLLKPNHSVRFAFLPDGKDPDDMIRQNGAQGFQNVLDSALSLVDFLWMVHTQNRDTATPEARAGIAHDIRSAIKVIDDKDVQAHYNAQVSKRISDTFFKRESYQGRGQGRSYGGASGRKRPQAVKPKRPSFHGLAPRILIATVISHPHIYFDVEEEFGHIDMGHPRLDAMRNILGQAISEAEPPLDGSGARIALAEAGFEKELGDVLHESVLIHAGFAQPNYKETDVLARWQQLYEAVSSHGLGNEIRSGLERAMQSGDLNDEQSILSLAKETKSV